MLPTETQDRNWPEFRYAMSRLRVVETFAVDSRRPTEKERFWSCRRRGCSTGVPAQSGRRHDATPRTTSIVALLRAYLE